MVSADRCVDKQRKSCRGPFDHSDSTVSPRSLVGRGSVDPELEPEPSERAALTTISQDIVDKIVLHLGSRDKVSLAICCKVMLPVLWTGHVSAWLNKPNSRKPVTQLARCLTLQPDGVTHLQLFSQQYLATTHRLLDLSLLTNLRKITLHKVQFPLPSLQSVATRLHSLRISDSCLHDSAAGFLSTGWTALKSLSLSGTSVLDAFLTALSLPALEALDIRLQHRRGGMMRVDQLCCPQLRSLTLDVDSRLARTSEGSRQLASFPQLSRLETLTLLRSFEYAIVELGLPASLQHLTVQDASCAYFIDLKWVLFEAVKVIRSGARLRSLTCINSLPASHPAGMPWGASSVAHYRDLGQQLSSLTELCVHGKAATLLSAISTTAGAAPSLTRLAFCVEEELDDLELPPIRSASLESITGRYRLMGHRGPPPPVVMTLLPGCTRLRDVRVHFYGMMPNLEEGTSVKICHCASRGCIVPLHACGPLEVGVQFLPPPPSPQGVQAHTVLCTYHAAGPEQPAGWGHVVMPGVA